MRENDIEKKARTHKHSAQGKCVGCGGCRYTPSTPPPPSRTLAPHQHAPTPTHNALTYAFTTTTHTLRQHTYQHNTTSTPRRPPLHTHTISPPHTHPYNDFCSRGCTQSASACTPHAPPTLSPPHPANHQLLATPHGRGKDRKGLSQCGSNPAAFLWGHLLEAGPDCVCVSSP
jgi:hypothetical protein